MSKPVIRILIAVIIFMNYEVSCIASENRLPPMSKKNRNQVTDFFPKEVKDKAAIDAMMNKSQVDAENTIKGF